VVAFSILEVERGGDLKKWDKYTEIYAIEPAEENRNVFRQRLGDYPRLIETVSG